jgi:tetratricopeptide (TPR) repeat protein
MKKYLPSWRTLVIATFVVFSAGVMCGWNWWDKQSAQTQQYMLGNVAYKTTMYEVAVQYFDKSYASYGEESQKVDAFSPPPSLELAELSQHFKALSLIKMGNAKLAIIAFKEALKLTTEYAIGQQNLPPDVIAKLIADRKVTQIDFEILFNQKQDEAKKEGKGKGDPKPGDPKQSNDPSKGQAAGKTDRNAL